MASSKTLVNAALLIFLAIAVAAPQAQAMNCGQVVQRLLPCLGYLRNGGAASPACCNGVRSLNSEVRNTPDRQQVCVCFKQAIPAYGINYGFANSMPGKCGVNLGITKSMDCSRYASVQSAAGCLRAGSVRLYEQLKVTLTSYLHKLQGALKHDEQ
ncbi:hypothetical protein Cgig2_031944 [Carnegiea gigantea]|uniref:Non-specific lipid-transfer protein n=1 Tax=Carnegiea gigantea TaxID=171969 RepID=A0A9Q1K621_9CARY|nr:hypothetical protein Cgig2_031944 [Carnegiea gigantea]